MNAVSTMAIVFLLGVATPIYGLRMLVKGREGDGSGCLLNFALIVIALFIFVLVCSG